MILSSVLIFLSLVIGNYGQLAYIYERGDDGCMTPTKEKGDCRNLKNCSVLVEVLGKNQPSGTLLVKESICGFEGLESLVCCPMSSNTSGSLLESFTDFSEESINKDQCGQVHFQTDKIVGGDDAILGEWPWLAALGYQTLGKAGLRWLCGGALVTRRHVITAAHCIDVSSDRKLTVVRLGDLNLIEGVADGATPLDVQVDQSFPHPNYSSRSKVNDIAIVRLKSDVPFSENIRPICLPNISHMVFSSLSDKIVKVAGWGRLEFGGTTSKMLQQVELKITDDETCGNVYRSYEDIVIDNRVMCAGTPGKSACQGDSGGPLVLVQNFTYYLVGVVSYGRGCGEPGYPGVATRVSSFVPWITTNLK